MKELTAPSTVELKCECKEGASAQDQPDPTWYLTGPLLTFLVPLVSSAVLNCSPVRSPSRLKPLLLAGRWWHAFNLKTSLVYKSSYRPAKARQWDLVSNNNNNNKQKHLYFLFILLLSTKVVCIALCSYSMPLTNPPECAQAVTAVVLSLHFYFGCFVAFDTNLFLFEILSSLDLSHIPSGDSWREAS